MDIRRVRGKPAYAYFGAHGKLHETFEPWSSAKFMAASATMARSFGQRVSRMLGPPAADVDVLFYGKQDAAKVGGMSAWRIE